MTVRKKSKGRKSTASEKHMMEGMPMMKHPKKMSMSPMPKAKHPKSMPKKPMRKH